MINEIPRGSKRYNLIKKFRSAAERANSTMKEDLKIIEKPSLRLVEFSNSIQLGLRPVGDQRAYAPVGERPSIPKSIANLTQLE